jgi:hypothetical protein
MKPLSGHRGPPPLPRLLSQILDDFSPIRAFSIQSNLLFYINILVDNSATISSRFRPASFAAPWAKTAAC